jgi:hypothetical protein
VLVPGAETALVDRIFPDEASITRLISELGDPKALAVCYEAGPTGYALARCSRGGGWPARSSPPRSSPWPPAPG